MSRAPAHPVTMKIRTATMRTEVQGDITLALDQLLVACGDAPAREAALVKLQGMHQRICDWELAAGSEGGTA